MDSPRPRTLRVHAELEIGKGGGVTPPWGGNGQTHSAFQSSFPPSEKIKLQEVKEATLATARATEFRRPFGAQRPGQGVRTEGAPACQRGDPAARPLEKTHLGAAPMAVAAALAGLQAEANCPVCLDGLSDPVTIDCGHNFCRRCIQQSWAHLEDRFPCPVCRHPCQERHVRSNTQLGRMIDIARQLGGRRSKRRRREEPRLCERHHQVLGLFCEDDLELLCPLCTQPPEHQGHVVRSVGEAAAHHRKRLGSYVEPLKTRVADAQSLVAAQDRKLLELREQVQRQRRELALEFGQLNRAVDREQEAVLERLVQEERDIQEQLGANVAAFSDHISTLKGLLQEVAERSVLPGVRLLRGIGGVLRRCEGLRCPAVYSFQLRREGCSLPPQHSALRKIIQTFREDVSLDPETAHPSLLVSEDRKSATFLGRKRRAPRGARRFSAEPAVLGAQGFARGRRYWEVRLGGPAWAVGVCADPADPAPGTRTGRPAGPGGRWTVRLRGGAYEAQGPGGAVPLELKDRPGGVGVYLDYELGAVSFYSVDDRSHLHSFSAAFSEVLKPYFCIRSDSLTVCAVRDYGGDPSQQGPADN
ncbi:tripartite motif-containing protein 75-like [Camelus bactrianus]|uniref:Tripartite motif-containing protein 75-like n=1 Tax=Camelus bactrianus TaxID=9837 RepID=A0AC58RAD4_CAMBA